MGNLERRLRRLEEPRGNRGAMSFENLTDEELDARIQIHMDAFLANPDTEDCLREAILYERENGHGAGRVIAILREDLARTRS
jgi:hypothetical protein